MNEEELKEIILEKTLKNSQAMEDYFRRLFLCLSLPLKTREQAAPQHRASSLHSVCTVLARKSQGKAPAAETLKENGNTLKENLKNGKEKGAYQ